LHGLRKKKQSLSKKRGRSKRGRTSGGGKTLREITDSWDKTETLADETDLCRVALLRRRGIAPRLRSGALGGGTVLLNKLCALPRKMPPVGTGGRRSAFQVLLMIPKKRNYSLVQSSEVSSIGINKKIRSVCQKKGSGLPLQRRKGKKRTSGGWRWSV